jgi:hypothetical protein
LSAIWPEPEPEPGARGVERGRGLEAWTGAAATRALRAVRRRILDFMVVGLWLRK